MRMRERHAECRHSCASHDLRVDAPHPHQGQSGGREERGGAPAPQRVLCSGGGVWRNAQQRRWSYVRASGTCTLAPAAAHAMPASVQTGRRRRRGVERD
eukprot:4139169-Prymnesium_polylepis.2